MPPIYPCLCIALLLAWVAPIPSLRADAVLPDLRQIRLETRKLAQIGKEMEETATRIATHATELEKRLAREEQTLEGNRVDVEMLEKARLELDSMQSSLAVLEGRIEHHGLKLDRLRAQIAQLEQRLAGAAQLDLELLRLEAGLELLRDQEVQRKNLLKVFDRVVRVGRRNAELLDQRLRLYQSRLTLEDINPETDSLEDKRIPMLQSLIADFLYRAARLFKQADGIVGDTPAAQARRRSIEQMAEAAVTRAYLRQNDLELILTENRLESLLTLLDDPSMPLHVLKSAQRKLQQIADTLQRIDEALAGQSTILESRQTALQRGDSGADTQRQGAEDMQALIGFQRSDIDGLHQRLSSAQTLFARKIGERHAVSLLQHRALPRAAADWQRIASGVRHLPRLVAETLAGFWKDLKFHTRETESRRILLACLVALLVVVLMFWGSRQWRITSPGAEVRRAPALTVNAIAHAAPRSIPAVLWGIIAGLLEVRPETLLPILMLLGLWPAYAFARHLARDALLGGSRDKSAGSADEKPNANHQKIYRHLSLGLKVIVGISAIYLLRDLLPLPPLLSDLLDRLMMLAMLLLLIPALGLKRLASRSATERQDTYGHWVRLRGLIPRLLPLLIALISLAGLLGYTNLAWTLVQYSLWLLVVMLILFFALGLLKDLAARMNGRLQQSVPDLAPFWRTHFVEPGYRIAQLTGLIGAGWLLFLLWGWNTQTPMLRWFVDAIETRLFMLGERTFTLGDLLLSLLLLGIAFWIGGWSKQVSYQLAYRRIHDLGLRQALATFTQYVVIVIGVLFALTVIGFDLTTLTVFLASLGVGIGFGLQNIVNNFLSGILLLAERPLVIGDFVSIGPHDGHVTQIGIRSLTVRTLDKQEVVIPNGSVISKEFTNWTRSDDVVRDVQYLMIQFASDREQAIKLIREVLAAHPQVLPYPEPGVFLAQYTELGVKLRFQYCYRLLNGPGRLVICSELLMEIGRRFAENRIAFAEPRLLPSIPLSGGLLPS